MNHNGIMPRLYQGRRDLAGQGDIIFDNQNVHDLAMARALKAHRKLRGEQMIVITRTSGLLLKTVLELQLSVRRKTICRRDVDFTEVVPPAFVIVDLAEDLLVPAHCAENLRREFIFRFKVVRESVGVAHPRHFEACFVKFRPHLQMMQCEADILAENELTIIVDVATARQCPFRFGSKIRAIARRQTKVPYLARAETETRIKCGIAKTNLSNVP